MLKIWCIHIFLSLQCCEKIGAFILHFLSFNLTDLKWPKDQSTSIRYPWLQPLVATHGRHLKLFIYLSLWVLRAVFSCIFVSQMSTVKWCWSLRWFFRPRVSTRCWWAQDHFHPDLVQVDSVENINHSMTDLNSGQTNALNTWLGWGCSGVFTWPKVI